ncbi:hypothetical protein BJV74DRAFT_952571 [Russula compacta]|nr:hypothetical protein BJV74DRAFT_952571 [Russula compacta]
MRSDQLNINTYSTRMLHPLFPAQSPEIISRDVPTNGFQCSRTSIHILNDDVLLNIFYLYLPISLPVDEDHAYLVDVQGWHQECWYKLAHICHRWRCLVLASASYLRLSLLCTYRMPVADMLAHSPPLPLIIDYFHDNDHDVTTEDEEQILLALQHSDRVRSIRLLMPVRGLQKPTKAIDNEFAILECLVIMPPTKEITGLVLPKTFQAPHLRHLLLMNFVFPLGSPLLMTSQAVNLVSLSLGDILQSANFHPNDLLQPLLHTPQLETLWIDFHTPVPNHDVEGQLLHSPIMTHITLPNLRNFAFGGASVYLEALLPHMTTPLLETLRIEFFGQLSSPLPHLVQFLSSMENLSFSRAALTFGERISMSVYPNVVARMDLLYMEVMGGHLDWQVASAVQIIHALKIVFSSVEHLILKYTDRYLSSPANEADRSQWRELLRSFSSLKVLHVPRVLIRALSHSLASEDGESPMELLPELKELSYSGSGDDGDALTRFITSRQNAGHPVSLIHD